MKRLCLNLETSYVFSIILHFSHDSDVRYMVLAKSHAFDSAAWLVPVVSTWSFTNVRRHPLITRGAPPSQNRFARSTAWKIRCMKRHSFYEYPNIVRYNTILFLHCTDWGVGWGTSLMTTLWGVPFDVISAIAMWRMQSSSILATGSSWPQKFPCVNSKFFHNLTKILKYKQALHGR